LDFGVNQGAFNQKNCLTNDENKACQPTNPAIVNDFASFVGKSSGIITIN
jgi:hypothetical protein